MAGCRPVGRAAAARASGCAVAACTLASHALPGCGSVPDVGSLRDCRRSAVPPVANPSAGAGSQGRSNGLNVGHAACCCRRCRPARDPLAPHGLLRCGRGPAVGSFRHCRRLPVDSAPAGDGSQVCRIGSNAGHITYFRGGCLPSGGPLVPHGLSGCRSRLDVGSLRHRCRRRPPMGATPMPPRGSRGDRSGPNVGSLRHCRCQSSAERRVRSAAMPRPAGRGARQERRAARARGETGALRPRFVHCRRPLRYCCGRTRGGSGLRPRRGGRGR